MSLYEPKNGKEFTFGELMNYRTENLESLRDQMKSELQELQKEKMLLCANIMSLQGLIKKETATNDTNQS